MAPHSQNFINELRCLVLNGNWAAIGVCSVRKSLENLCSSAYLSIDFSGGNLLPLPWEDWVNLEIGPNDDFVSAAHQQVRVPRVIIAKNYRKIPKKKLSLNTNNLAKIYDSTCCYTNKKLSKKNMSQEHLKPVSLGGENTWENVVLADRDVNSLRGNMSLEDFKRKHGYELQIKPKAPKEKLVSDFIENTYGYEEWAMFLRVK